MYCGLILFVVFILAASTRVAETRVYCKCRGEECERPPKEECIYGTYRDACGRISCSSGPGERCGGRENHLGKCGDGMSCKCGKCKGCSILRLLKGDIKCEVLSPFCS